MPSRSVMRVLMRATPSAMGRIARGSGCCGIRAWPHATDARWAADGKGRASARPCSTCAPRTRRLSRTPMPDGGRALHHVDDGVLVELPSMKRPSAFARSARYPGSVHDCAHQSRFEGGHVRRSQRTSGSSRRSRRAACPTRGGCPTLSVTYSDTSAAKAAASWRLTPATSEVLWKRIAMMSSFGLLSTGGPPSHPESACGRREVGPKGRGRAALGRPGRIPVCGPPAGAPPRGGASRGPPGPYRARRP